MDSRLPDNYRQTDKIPVPGKHKQPDPTICCHHSHFEAVDNYLYCARNRRLRLPS